MYAPSLRYLVLSSLNLRLTAGCCCGCFLQYHLPSYQHQHYAIGWLAALYGQLTAHWLGTAPFHPAGLPKRLSSEALPRLLTGSIVLPFSSAFWILTAWGVASSSELSKRPSRAAAVWSTSSSEDMKSTAASSELLDACSGDVCTSGGSATCLKSKVKLATITELR